MSAFVYTINDRIEGTRHLMPSDQAPDGPPLCGRQLVGADVWRVLDETDSGTLTDCGMCRSSRRFPTCQRPSTELTRPNELTKLTDMTNQHSNFVPPEPMVSVDIPGHGVYSAPAWVVDQMHQEHYDHRRSSRVNILTIRANIEDRTDGGEDWHDVHELFTMLVVLADFEHAAMLNEAEAAAKASS